MSLHLTYQSNLDELKKLAEDIKAFGEQENLHNDITYALNLCLDEIITNIISHGFKNKPKEPIKIELNREEDYVTAIVRDKGTPFNPAEEANYNPDVHANLEDRNVGGLGVYLLHKYIDHIEYSREHNENTLTLTTKAF